MPAPIYQRARAPPAAELGDIPWLAGLDREERAVAIRDLKVVQIGAGELLCRVGRPVTYWFGVIDGFLKMSNDSDTGHAGDPSRAQSMPITFTGVPPGGWFGEGTVIKREVYRYNIQAVRTSVAAGLSVDTFHWLLDRSIPFNRFIIQQLNERLGQFIGARETDRMINVDARVARSLGALFHPVLYPGVGGLLRITQQELGYLIGLSRQRVNEALNSLQDRGLIRIEYGGVSVLDLDGLRKVG
jgi:CRP-like cAMP-binding protein